jgi:hypothetical protein
MICSGCGSDVLQLVGNLCYSCYQARQVPVGVVPSAQPLPAMAYPTYKTEKEIELELTQNRIRLVLEVIATLKGIPTSRAPDILNAKVEELGMLITSEAEILMGEKPVAKKSESQERDEVLAEIKRDLAVDPLEGCIDRALRRAWDKGEATGKKVYASAMLAFWTGRGAGVLPQEVANWLRKEIES